MSDKTLNYFDSTGIFGYFMKDRRKNSSYPEIQVKQVWVNEFQLYILLSTCTAILAEVCAITVAWVVTVAWVKNIEYIHVNSQLSNNTKMC